MEIFFTMEYDYVIISWKIFEKQATDNHLNNYCLSGMLKAMKNRLELSYLFF